MTLAPLHLHDRAAPVARSTTAIDAARALGTLRAAFADDPAVRWLFPDDRGFRDGFDDLARVLGGPAFRDGTLRTGPGAAALWVRPGAGPDDLALVALVERTIPQSRHDAVFGVFDAMGRAHPDRPHWYLPMIGVTPDRQGVGAGTALMAPVLSRCDAEGATAYLEATTPRNAALYARLGFEAGSPIELGGCPPLLPMTRRPGGRA